MEIDEKLYSRQLYVMGKEAQSRMMRSHALVIGLSGLGAEVAKNIILAGLARVTLCDPTPPDSYDLGGNFYLSEADLGGRRSRADLCRGPLSELNQYVQVDAVGADGIPSLAGPGGRDSLLALLEALRPTVVVVTVPLPHATAAALGDRCRSLLVGAAGGQPICFVYAYVAGLFARTFCDFGPAFVVTDRDGENPATSQIEAVLPGSGPEAPATVKVLEDQGRHGLETGDFVTFSRVRGGAAGEGGTGTGTGIDEGTEYEVRVTGPYTFELVGVVLPGGSGPAATQGYITQAKRPVEMAFRSYSEASASPREDELMLSDFAKFDRPPLLHAAFRALEEAAEVGGGLPRPGNAPEAEAVLALARGGGDAASFSGEASARLVRQLASGSRAVLSPVCAATGGIVGQEVLKACSGKFTPIRGFLYLDASECLPDEGTGLHPADQVAPTGSSRYDSQVAVLGREVQKRLLDLNYFLVGAGAIGCEMLKNWALMGVGCGENGRVHVTDMDRIEKSNLSRQFLFRPSDINDFKSTCAASKAREMNPEMKLTSYQDRVGAETDHIFGDAFYDTLSGVCTALDNVEARLYVDQKCVFYKLPMLESGTLGTKGNTQVVVPQLTENYGATRDPPEKSIPVCTLKNFPSLIQHTLQWARDYFEGEFRQGPEDVNAYLSSADYTSELSGHPTRLDTARSVQRVLVNERPTTFEDCVIWARLKFEDLFSNQIKQLLHNFPPHQLTGSGTKFWSGSKRCPMPLSFDMDERCEDAGMRNAYDFIVAAANLRAAMFGISGQTDEAYFRKVLKNVMVPDYVPAEGVKIASSDAEAKEQEEKRKAGGDVDGEGAEFDKILASLPKASEMSGFSLSPIDFDKDLDDHMLFVTAASNLRAMNYQIPTEDTHRSRAIAGRIIPAIATTTALVTGLICTELYKIVGSAGRECKLDDLKNGFINIAIPFMTLSEPTPPAKTKTILKGKEWEFSAWDCLDVEKGDITLGEFLAYFEDDMGLDVQMLSYGAALLFSFFANPKKVKERKAMSMTKVIESVTKKPVDPNQVFLTLELIACDLETDEEVELPAVRMRIR